jgi:hypothetical protein
MHPGGPGFFSFWGEGWGVEFLLFPMCSNEVVTFLKQVLNGFLTFSPSSQGDPQHVPNSSSLYPVSFALSSRVTYNEPEGGDYNVSILGLFKSQLIFL